MRVLKNPVAQFLAAGFVTVLLVALATGLLSGRAAEDEAIDHARAVTELLPRAPSPSRRSREVLVEGDPGAVDRFDRRVLDRLLVDDVERVKIWDASGRIVYRTRPG